MTGYRVTVDKEACDGIFACLVRDDRFAESEDGLATVDSDSAVAVDETDGEVVATFDDDCIDRARQAADACPPSAITVEEVSSVEGTEAEVSEPCR